MVTRELPFEPKGIFTPMKGLTYSWSKSLKFPLKCRDVVVSVTINGLAGRIAWFINHLMIIATQTHIKMYRYRSLVDHQRVQLAWFDSVLW